LRQIAGVPVAAAMSRMYYFACMHSIWKVDGLLYNVKLDKCPDVKNPGKQNQFGDAHDGKSADVSGGRLSPRVRANQDRSWNVCTGSGASFRIS